MSQVRSEASALDVSRVAAPVSAQPIPGLAVASVSGERVPATDRSSPVAGPWPEGTLSADATALRLRMAADAVALPLGRAAARLFRRKTWAPFGFARLDDYARERLDRSGRWVRDMAALGEGIGRLPELASAVTGADGGPPIGRVSAILISRVATVDSVAAWIRFSRNSTVRQLKAAAMRARAQGSCRPEGDPRSTGGAGDGSEGAANRTTDVETDERSVIRFVVPSPVRVAFDETLDLHRAVNGHDATVASFVEALVAEAYAGPHPPDADTVPAQGGPDESQLEEILSRSTALWAHLAPVMNADGLREADGVNLEAGLKAECGLREVGEAGTDSPAEVGPREVDRQLRSLIELESRICRRLGQVLAEMSERGAWSTLMFRGVRHYAEQRLGLGRSATADRVRLHRALRRFPLIREAYERGDLGLEAGLSIVRLLDRGPADSALESLWVDRACHATVKRLRDETRHLGRLKPCGPIPANARRSLVRLAPLDDARWHATLRRDPGMAIDRVRTLGDAAVPDEHAPMRPGAVQGFGCPDVFLRLRVPRDIADAFLATVECRRRDLARRVENIPWDEPWPDPDAPSSVRAARTFSNRAHRVPLWVALLALLEDYVATWDDPASMPKRKADRIYRRDGWRCAAPGCSSREHLEDHHVIYRSRGGSDDESNRTCLCRFHHQRGEHGGLASCRGTAPLDIVWRLGRKDLAVRYRNEIRLTRQRESRRLQEA